MATLARAFLVLALVTTSIGAVSAEASGAAATADATDVVEAGSAPAVGESSADASADDASAAVTNDDATDWGRIDENLRYALTGQWIDPPGAFWVPRRGARTELSLFLGGEAALGELGALDQIPSIGGSTLTGVARYYPVDRLAITIGTKGYLGVAKPAAGTTAETVFSPFAGVRWDLVRENRFSLLADVNSGPALFLFADVLGALGAAWAVGGEAQAAATLRYSLGPWTAELRAFVGGRVGEAQEIGRPGFDVGPFSALYAGVDTGITWSFWAEDHPDNHLREGLSRANESSSHEGLARANEGSRWEPPAGHPLAGR